MKTIGLKAKLAEVNARIADVNRLIAETLSDLNSDADALAEAALRRYEDIKYQYLLERAELASQIGRKS
jgi:hypothetical protein